MPKPILFVDFNGVISYNNYWCSLEDEKHELHHYYELIEQFLFQDNKDLLKDWMRGKYTSEEIHLLLEKHTGVNASKLLEVFIYDCSTLDISQKILDALQKIRPYYYTILRTDNMDSFDRFTLPKAPRLKKTFDRLDNSYNLKSLKKDDNGIYFTERAHELKVSINDCILIDDTKSNCDFYCNMGGHAYCVTGEIKVVGVINKLLNL